MNRISDILQQLQRHLEKERLELGELLEALRERGPFFILMILSVPFLQPIALPGVSTPFGFLSALLAFGMWIGRDVPIPRRVLRYAMPRKGVSLLFRGAIALFRKLERWTRPHRLGTLIGRERLLRFHAFLMLTASMLLMLPLPIPFSNSLPAYTTVFIALGYLLRDGVLLIIAYGFAALTAAYFVLIAIVGFEGFQLLTQKLWAG